MTQDLIGYQELVESALRSVACEALRRTAERGLPGAHHFYVTFRTGDAGVVIPDYLRARYPEEMTIVLQHQFWGLEVDDHAFSVTLSFNNIGERLTIPWSAMTAFIDPSVQFGLQFGAGAVDAAEHREEREEGRQGAAAQEPEQAGEAEVVSLDAFRKK